MSGVFVKGLDLCQSFYEEAVGPLMATHFPHLPYSAARIVGGSDVLGFDTPQSMDHDWGPRMMLFLDETDFESQKSRVDEMLRRELPYEVR